MIYSFIYSSLLVSLLARTNTVIQFKISSTSKNYQKLFITDCKKSFMGCMPTSDGGNI